MSEQRPRLVDVSRYNGKTNLKAVVDAWGVVGVMARCTIGHAYVDPYYAWNLQQSRELGLLFGAYHVTRPQERQPKAEASWCRDHLNVGELKPDFLVADSELPNKPDDWKLITPQAAGAVLVDTYAELRRQIALWLAIYTGSWWWNSPDHLGKATPLGIGDDYMLIEAEYVTTRAEWGKVDFARAPEAPRMPSPGRDWKPEQCVGWQWTDGLKPIGNGADGINRMDGNVLLVSLEHFLELIGKKMTLSDKAKLELLWQAHPDLHPTEVVNP